VIDYLAIHHIHVARLCYLDLSKMPSMDGISHNGASDEGDVPYVDVLIVGAGPAGASLACFLASHGMFLYQNWQS
jgi:alkyl hydroperoxide reductase subunit AhpF